MITSSISKVAPNSHLELIFLGYPSDVIPNLFKFICKTGGSLLILKYFLASYFP